MTGNMMLKISIAIDRGSRHALPRATKFLQSVNEECESSNKFNPDLLERSLHKKTFFRASRAAVFLE